jgi:hypothetical protein
MNKTKIANNALDFLGEELINNIDEDSATAKLIRRHFEDCLIEILDSQAFDLGYEILKLELVSKDVFPRPYDIRYQYAYYNPPNALFVKFVSTKEKIKNYELEKLGGRLEESPRFINKSGRRFILSNVEEAFAVCFMTPCEDDILPIDFANALSYLLASKISGKLGSDVNKQSAMIAMYNYYSGKALAKSLNRQAEYKKNNIRVPRFLQDR